MKTNLFKVKEKKEKKIIIEEEQYKNPIILFFLRNKKFILMMIALLILCLLLISVGFAFSLFRGSTDFDITFLTGEETITPNPSPDVNDDTVEEVLTGRGTVGVVLLVETFMTYDGDIISYYSDGTSIVVKKDGTIYKVYPTKEGNYGVDRRGNFLDDSVRNKITSRTQTLDDGTVITYYSDGSASLNHDDVTVLVRDSNNIDNDNEFFKEVRPSGVSIEKEKSKIGNDEITQFTDDTYVVLEDGKKSVVNRNTKVDINDNSIGYDKNNSFGVLEEKKLNDGNTITYFEDGSAVIEDENGKDIYVHKSGDIVVKDDKIFEIVPSKRGDNTYEKKCPDGKKVTYYDNGSAVIEDENGNKSYVEDNRNIVYGSDGNISDVKEEPSKVKSTGKTTTGDDVVNFENGKSQVVEDNGNSYIVDTKDIIPSSDKDNDKDSDNNKDDGDKEEDKNNTKPNDSDKNNNDNETIDTNDIYVSDSESTYREEYNIQDTNFTIRNSSNSSKKYRIVIQEVTNYKKFNTSRLDPRFVKFQAVIAGIYVSSTRLDSNIWHDNADGTVNYVIYDGQIRAKSTISVALSLYIDYANLDNSYQNKGFIGTIKVYLVTD